MKHKFKELRIIALFEFSEHLHDIVILFSENTFSRVLLLLKTLKTPFYLFVFVFFFFSSLGPGFPL